MAGEPQKYSTVDSRNPQKIVILGAGAIGAFYGQALANGGANVTLVCRSEYPHVKKNGFQILSEERGDAIFHPANVLNAEDQFNDNFPDYLVVSMKVVGGSERISPMTPFVGPNTVIVLIQNGVEIENDVAKAFPANQIISCLAFVQVSRISPGVVRHYAYGELTMGNFPSGISEQCQRFAALLNMGKISTVLTENVVGARWQKCLWNAPFNPVSVLGGPIDTRSILGLPDGEKLIRDLMDEVSQVASSVGHPIPQGLIDRYIEVTNAAPPYKTSMALDRERGQGMEVETILGNTVRVAHRQGIPVPRLEAIYALMQMLEAQDKK